MCPGGTKKEAGKKLLRLSHLPLYSVEEKERLPEMLLVWCSYVPDSWGSSYISHALSNDGSSADEGTALLPSQQKKGHLWLKDYFGPS